MPRIRRTVEWIKDIFDLKNNPWFREEFVHPDEFGDVKICGYFR